MNATMTNVLKPGAVYFADNGELVCRKCAGATALYSGHDLSGQKLLRVDVDTVRYLLATERGPVSCERGCTILEGIPGPDGWPMVLDEKKEG